MSDKHDTSSDDDGGISLKKSIPTPVPATESSTKVSTLTINLKSLAIDSTRTTLEPDLKLRISPHLTASINPLSDVGKKLRTPGTSAKVGRFTIRRMDVDESSNTTPSISVLTNPTTFINPTSSAASSPITKTTTEDEELSREKEADIQVIGRFTIVDATDSLDTVDDGGSVIDDTTSIGVPYTTSTKEEDEEGAQLTTGIDAIKKRPNKHQRRKIGRQKRISEIGTLSHPQKINFLKNILQQQQFQQQQLNAVINSMFDDTKPPDANGTMNMGNTGITSIAESEDLSIMDTTPYIYIPSDTTNISTEHMVSSNSIFQSVAAAAPPPVLSDKLPTTMKKSVPTVSKSTFGSSSSSSSSSSSDPIHVILETLRVEVDNLRNINKQLYQRNKTLEKNNKKLIARAKEAEKKLANVTKPLDNNNNNPSERRL